MENNVLFKTVEVVGRTKDEALTQLPFNPRVNATQAYKKWRETQTEITESNVREWKKEFLKNKKYTFAGDGAYIVVQSAVADTRERPYKVVKAKHEARTHSPERFYVLRTANGNEVARAKNSTEAIQLAKEYVSELKEDVFIKYEWSAKEKNDLYATVNYTPSKGTKSAVIEGFGYVSAE